MFRKNRPNFSSGLGHFCFCPSVSSYVFICRLLSGFVYGPGNFLPVPTLVVSPGFLSVDGAPLFTGFGLSFALKQKKFFAQPIVVSRNNKLLDTHIWMCNG